MFVKPTAGLRVRDPVKKDFLPTEGREVTMTSYWIRRLKDKDVVEGDSTTVTNPEKTTTSVLAKTSKWEKEA